MTKVRTSQLLFQFKEIQDTIGIHRLDSGLEGLVGVWD